MWRRGCVYAQCILFDTFEIVRWSATLWPLTSPFVIGVKGGGGCCMQLAVDIGSSRLCSLRTYCTRGSVSAVSRTFAILQTTDGFCLTDRPRVPDAPAHDGEGWGGISILAQFCQSAGSAMQLVTSLTLPLTPPWENWFFNSQVAHAPCCDSNGWHRAKTTGTVPLFVASALCRGMWGTLNRNASAYRSLRDNSIPAQAIVVQSWT